MKRILIATVVVLVFSSLTSAQGGYGGSTGSAEEIRRLIRAGAEARMRGDSKVIDQILASDYTRVYPDGSIRNKGQTMESLKDPSPSNTLESVKILEMDVLVYGDWAMDTTLAERKYKGQAMKKTRYTCIWVLRDGRWQILRLHSSDLPS